MVSAAFTVLAARSPRASLALQAAKISLQTSAFEIDVTHIQVMAPAPDLKPAVSETRLQRSVIAQARSVGLACDMLGLALGADDGVGDLTEKVIKGHARDLGRARRRGECVVATLRFTEMRRTARD